MKYLSVCSGIEAATVAWHSLGWEPLAFSEIEPFPRKMLTHHYPDVPLHGDFTVLREQDWIKDADILVGGTPCQAFSVAGLRNSLGDDRGNLTLEFVRLADAIDDLRSDGTIIVWENVPGVLSVKDNAFGCFLGALVGNDEPLIPTGGKWTNSGMVMGPKRRAAWRVLDAQYFGVAQRRRRLFVVASARDGFDPAEVLFEREGLRRDTPPCRSKGKETAKCLTTGVGQRYDPETETLPIMTNSHVSEGVAPQYTEEVSDTLSVGANQTTGFQSPSIVAHITGPITAGISKGMRGTEGIDSNWAVMQPMAFQQNTRDEVRYINGDGQIVGALAADSGMKQTNYIAQPVPFGVGENPDLGHCLRSGASKADKHESTTYVAQPYSIMPMNSGKDYKAREVDVAQPVMAAGPTGGNQGGDYIVQPVTFSAHMSEPSVGDNQSTTLQAKNPMAVAYMQSIGTDCFNGSITGNIMAVRRLTPRECERLQGFPDDYTAIPGAADGPRYKSLGNSMAVPVMAWIGKRIANEYH